MKKRRGQKKKSNRGHKKGSGILSGIKPRTLHDYFACKTPHESSAILNKSAVALPADSAVTIGTDRGPKIFNTVNKLFTLSKCCPVGAMVYGSAQLMSVPWETLIKTYRAKLRDKSFAHLEDYASDFLRYLAGNRGLFPAADQTQYFQRLVSAFYKWINSEVQTGG